MRRVSVDTHVKGKNLMPYKPRPAQSFQISFHYQCQQQAVSMMMDVTGYVAVKLESKDKSTFSNLHERRRCFLWP